MPTIGKRCLTAENLLAHLLPCQGCVRGGFEAEAVLVEFRPTTIDTIPRNRVRAAVGTPKPVVGLGTLIATMPQKFHHHLAAGCPAPHTGFLCPECDWLRTN